MTTTPAIVALVATLALGVVVGLLYLSRSRKARLVTAHLVAALAATGLVAVLFVTAPSAPAGPPAILPLLMLAVATAAGWSAKRVARRSRKGAEAVLAGHVVLGLAGFFVFLAWAKAL